MKFYVALILTLASLSSFAHIEEKCFQKHRTDPYEPGYALNRGHYKDQCIDTSRTRAAYIVDQTDKYITFANFYHNHKWWIAYLPRHSGKETIFQIIRFSTAIPGMVAAHTELRFKLDPNNPMILHPQDSADQASIAPIKMTDITYSVEASRPAGVSYNVIYGQFDFYGIAGRLLSTESRADESFGPSQTEKNIINQVALNLSPEDSDRVLLAAVHRSDQLGLKYMYNTIKNNCTTELFNLLDFILEYPTKIKTFSINILNVMDPVDGPSRKALADRLLSNEGKVLPTLNEEFERRH